MQMLCKTYSWIVVTWLYPFLRFDYRISRKVSGEWIIIKASVLFIKTQHYSKKNIPGDKQPVVWRSLKTSFTYPWILFFHCSFLWLRNAFCWDRKTLGASFPVSWTTQPFINFKLEKFCFGYLIIQQPLSTKSFSRLGPRTHESPWSTCKCEWLGLCLAFWSRSPVTFHIL